MNRPSPRHTVTDLTPHPARGRSWSCESVGQGGTAHVCHRVAGPRSAGRWPPPCKQRRSGSSTLPDPRLQQQGSRTRGEPARRCCSSPDLSVGPNRVSWRTWTECPVPACASLLRVRPGCARQVDTRHGWRGRWEGPHARPPRDTDPTGQKCQRSGLKSGLPAWRAVSECPSPFPCHRARWPPTRRASARPSGTGGTPTWRYGLLAEQVA
jgi:hypothetical protein